MLLLPTPWIANAAGLGKLAVLSSLGQPFRAEIDLVLLQQDELASLSSRIASPDTYKQANFQYDSALSGLHLNVRQQPSGRAYIEIISYRSVNEPFFDLLIELDGKSTHLIRKYTALIDPPGFGPAAKTDARIVLPEALSTSVAESREIAAHIKDQTPLPNAEKGSRPIKKKSPDIMAAGDGNFRGLSYRIQILETKFINQSKALAALMKRISLAEDFFQNLQRSAYTKNHEIAAAQKQVEVEALARHPEAIKQKNVERSKPSNVSDSIKKERSQLAATPEKLAAQAKSEQQKSKSPPLPSPESSLVSDLIGKPHYLAMGGGIVILLCGIAFWMSRRRSQDVTPEDILNRLLIKDTGREDIRIKLLEIYVERNDKVAFHSAAAKFKELTNGQGENWLRIVEMGRAFDPGNPLYETIKNPMAEGEDLVTEAEPVTNTFTDTVKFKVINAKMATDAEILADVIEEIKKDTNEVK